MLNGVVVRDEYGDAALGDPIEKTVVPAIEDRTAAVHDFGIWLPVLLENDLAEAGVNAQHVTGLDHDPVCVHCAHHVVVADEVALSSELMVEVDKYPATLHARCGHGLDA
jgi:hypothetical protein